jgi:hypothetical protein
MNNIILIVAVSKDGIIGKMVPYHGIYPQI